MKLVMQAKCVAVYNIKHTILIVTTDIYMTSTRKNSEICLITQFHARPLLLYYSLLPSKRFYEFQGILISY